MGWIPDPDDPWGEFARFIFAPVLAPYTAYLAFHDYVLDTEHSDFAENARNAALWTSAAGGVFTWNYFMSPQNASWTTGKDAFHLLGHYASSTPHIAGPIALAAAPTALFFANKAVIESAPVDRQQSMWQMFSQALTGTGPGVGNADLGF